MLQSWYIMQTAELKKQYNELSAAKDPRSCSLFIAVSLLALRGVARLVMLYGGPVYCSVPPILLRIGFSRHVI
jgi:hypothetical protein